MNSVGRDANARQEREKRVDTGTDGTRCTSDAAMSPTTTGGSAGVSSDNAVLSDREGEAGTPGGSGKKGDAGVDSDVLFHRRSGYFSNSLSVRDFSLRLLLSVPPHPSPSPAPCAASAGCPLTVPVAASHPHVSPSSSSPVVPSSSSLPHPPITLPVCSSLFVRTGYLCPACCFRHLTLHLNQNAFVYLCSSY